MADVAHLSDLNLRVTWDNEATPAISTSLATLFGQGVALGSMTTTPMRINARDGSVSLELGLPFGKLRVQTNLVSAATRVDAKHTQCRLVLCQRRVQLGVRWRIVAQRGCLEQLRTGLRRALAHATRRHLLPALAQV
ncbi:MAG: hypothetical protein RL385_339 [Pseudomonadota bacterium]